jgi:serine/threonine protein kinase
LQLLLLSHLLDIAKGMAYLHEQHVLHADLKPANVLLCSPDGPAQCVLEEGSAAAEADGSCGSPPRAQAVHFRDMRLKISDFGLSHGMALGQSHHQTATVSPPTGIQRGTALGSALACRGGRLQATQQTAGTWMCCSVYAGVTAVAPVGALRLLCQLHRPELPHNKQVSHCSMPVMLWPAGGHAEPHGPGGATGGPAVHCCRRVLLWSAQ